MEIEHSSVVLQLPRQPSLRPQDYTPAQWAGIGVVFLCTLGAMFSFALLLLDFCTASSTCPRTAAGAGGVLLACAMLFALLVLRCTSISRRRAAPGGL